MSAGRGGLAGLRAGAGRGELVPRVPAPGGRRLPGGHPARGEGGGAAAGPADLVPVSAVSTAGPVQREISEAQDGICPSFCLVFPLPPCCCLAMIIAFIRLCLPYILPGALPAGSGEGNGRFCSAVSGLAAGLRRRLPGCAPNPLGASRVESGSRASSGQVISDVEPAPRQ